MRVGLITHRELLDQTRQHNISQYSVTDHKMRVNNYTPAVSRHNLHAVELRRGTGISKQVKKYCVVVIPFARKHDDSDPKRTFIY